MMPESSQSLRPWELFWAPNLEIVALWLLKMSHTSGDIHLSLFIPRAQLSLIPGEGPH